MNTYVCIWNINGIWNIYDNAWQKIHDNTSNNIYQVLVLKSENSFWNYTTFWDIYISNIIHENENLLHVSSLSHLVSSVHFLAAQPFREVCPTCTLTAFSVLQWELQILCHVAPCPIWLVQGFAFDLAWTKESLPKSDKSLDNNYSNIKTPGRKNKSWLREIPARDREILVTFNL